MIYSDSSLTKESVEASIVSVKRDLDAKIGLVERRYNDLLAMLEQETQAQKDLVEEINTDIDIIVEECNSLQGLTDEELTEIKRAIETIKVHLRGVNIPDLPPLPTVDDLFSGGSSTGCDIFGADVCTMNFCSTGDNVTVDDTYRLGGDVSKGTVFNCGDYSADTGCKDKFIVYEDVKDGTFVNGTCRVNWESCDMEFDAVSTAGCLKDFSSSDDMTCRAYSITIAGNDCTGLFTYEDLTCTGSFKEVFGDNRGLTCTQSYKEPREDGQMTDCSVAYSYSVNGGYSCPSNFEQTCPEDVDNILCPKDFVNNTDVKGCEGGYSVPGITCNNSYATSAAPQTISTCEGGYEGENSVKCPSNWSYGLGKNACNLNYSDGSITCAKGYITDGVRKWCDNHDAACGRCQLGYCAPANYTSCDYCPSYSPPCSYTPECSEGEPEPCHQEPTCQPCVDIADTCGGDYACSVNCDLAHDDCTGVCNVIRHGSDD